MKKTKYIAIMLSETLLITACANKNNTTKGELNGSGHGAT